MRELVLNSQVFVDVWNALKLLAILFDLIGQVDFLKRLSSEHPQSE